MQGMDGQKDALQSWLGLEQEKEVQTFGEVLKAKRERGNLKQRHVAYLLDITESYLSRLESDDPEEMRPPTLEILVKLLEVFKDDPQFRLDLLTWLFMFVHQGWKRDSGENKAMSSSVPSPTSPNDIRYVTPAHDSGKSTPRPDGTQEGDDA